jgi:hypothetical protein
MKNDLPVLLISFNRPDMTKGAIDNLRKIKPKKIYFSTDGPREGIIDDQISIDKCISMVRNIDWECEIESLVAEKNFGPGYWPQHSITWALTKTDRILILEHDVRISEDFYNFSNQLSIELEFDKQVFAICAFNFGEHSKIENNYEYFFSKYFSGWGWVTWADRWKDYEYDISNNISIKLMDMLKINNFNILTSLYFIYFINKVKNNRIQTWDFQINFLMFKKNLKVVKFFQNLATNVGGGLDATNTKYLPKMELQEKSSTILKKPLSSEIECINERKWRRQLLRYLHKSLLARLK